jgi:hypothetical protein
MRIVSLANEYRRNSKPKRRGKKDQTACVVYVSGVNEIEFGEQFFDYLRSRSVQVDGLLLACEIHIFAPNSKVRRILAQPLDVVFFWILSYVLSVNFQAVHQARDGLFIHNWGFRPKNKRSTGRAFKTLENTIAELKHSGRISVLALDCEACEWDIYKDVLSLEEPIQQVLMQLHGTPYNANELFLAMQEAGYLIFNREIRGDGDVWDYSWFRMMPSFFNWKQ